jgi:hypothetical protein
MRPGPPYSRPGSDLGPHGRLPLPTHVRIRGRRRGVRGSVVVTAARSGPLLRCPPVGCCCRHRWHLLHRRRIDSAGHRQLLPFFGRSSVLPWLLCRRVHEAPSVDRRRRPPYNLSRCCSSPVEAGTCIPTVLLDLSWFMSVAKQMLDGRSLGEGGGNAAGHALAGVRPSCLASGWACPYPPMPRPPRMGLRPQRRWVAGDSPPEGDATCGCLG